jgi:peptidoglycan/LPS O-acetylase OafA/YrhL
MIGAQEVGVAAPAPGRRRRRGFVPGGSTSGGAVPASQRARFDGFDGLRALAALSVLMLHVSWASGFTLRSSLGEYTARLDIGVSVFFLISGFLLYRPFAMTHLSGGAAPSWKRFWGRRALRILPAYWLALTVLAYLLHLVSMGAGFGGVISHYGLLQIYWPTQSFDGIPQAWSLATEVSFYLFLPFYALALSRRGRPAKRQLHLEIAGIILLVAMSNAFRWWALNIPWIVSRHGQYVAVCAPNCATDPTLASLMVTWLPSYLDLFGLGMLLAVLSAWCSARNHEPEWLSSRAVPFLSWGLAAATYVVVAHLPISRSPLYLVSPPLNLLRQALYGVFAFCLLLPAVFGRGQPSPVRRFLSSRVMTGVGVVSYGIYLWHLNLADALVRWLGYKPQAAPFPILAVTVIALSTAVAAASYLVVERPLLRLGRGRAPRSSSPSRTPAPAVGPHCPPEAEATPLPAGETVRS